MRSERTLVMIKSTLRRSIRRARVHNLIARNVVELVDRKSGDTETPKSKRSLELPKRAIAALAVHKATQAKERRAAGEAWHDNNLVFCYKNGVPYTSDQLNWRFGKMTQTSGYQPLARPRRTAHAASIKSSKDVPIQDISDTLGHKSTHVTGAVYRHVIVPEIRRAATVMDDVFNDDEDDPDEGNEKAKSTWRFAGA